MESNTQTAISSRSESISSKSMVQKSTMISSSSSSSTSRQITSMSSEEQIESAPMIGIGSPLAFANEEMLNKLTLGASGTPTDITKLLSSNVRNSLIQHGDDQLLLTPSLTSCSSALAASTISAKASTEMIKSSSVLSESDISMSSSALSTESIKQQRITAAFTTKSSSTMLESTESFDRSIIQATASMEVKKAENCS